MGLSGYGFILVNSLTHLGAAVVTLRAGGSLLDSYGIVAGAQDALVVMVPVLPHRRLELIEAARGEAVDLERLHLTGVFDPVHGEVVVVGAELNALVARVGDVIDRYRADELDAFDVDLALLQYSRAAKELWKFCSLMSPEIAAKIIRSEPPSDWWERGQPRRR